MPHEQCYLSSRLVDLAAKYQVRRENEWGYVVCDMWLIEMVDTDCDLVTLLLKSKSKIWEDKKRLGLLGEKPVSAFQTSLTSFQNEWNFCSFKAKYLYTQ